MLLIGEEEGERKEMNEKNKKGGTKEREPLEAMKEMKNILKGKLMMLQIGRRAKRIKKKLIKMTAKIK